MENQSDSPNEGLSEDGHYLKILVRKSSDLDQFKKESLPPYKISKDNPHIIVDSKESFWIFETFLDSKKELKIQKNEQNLISIVKYIYHELFLFQDKAAVSKQIDKKIIRYYKNKKKWIDKLSSNKEIQYDEKIQSDISYNNLFKKDDLIKDLPKKILSATPLESYLTCQLFVHSKGESHAESHSITAIENYEYSTININDFNELFNLIKKSKNKTFNQSHLHNKHLNFLGTFLAKDLDLTNHRLILIISRNDFLPALNKEKSFFNDLCDLLIPQLKIQLLKESFIKKKNILLGALNLIPLPLIVQNQDTVIFSNISYKKMECEGVPLEDWQQKSFLLKNEISLTLFQNLENSFSADKYHHQRISLLGELLNTLQHELSNPLFGLKLTSELLKNESLSEENITVINEIILNIERCQIIIENFSHLYKSETTVSNISIRKIIKKIFTLTKSETRGIDVQLSFSNLKKDEDVFLTLNPTWLTQIIFNLVINSSQAIKMHQEMLSNQFIDIEIRKENNNLKIMISDSGPGLPEDSIKLLFRPFYTTKASGTGLGLSICKNLAEKMNGKLICHNNNPLPGATFSLILPL